MHFKDDPISDMHVKNYLIILCLKHFPGPTKFGPVFWSRLFQRGPVEYNYPIRFAPCNWQPDAHFVCEGFRKFKLYWKLATRSQWPILFLAGI